MLFISLWRDIIKALQSQSGQTVKGAVVVDFTTNHWEFFIDAANHIEGAVVIDFIENQAVSGAVVRIILVCDMLFMFLCHQIRWRIHRHVDSSQ